jgi:tetratricopeptide (TPR) repeat protein
VLQEDGRLEEALRMYEQALIIRIGAYGRSHPRVADSQAAIGLVLLGQGHLEDAHAAFAEALPTYKTVFHDDHPRVAHTYNGLALIHRAKGEVARATVLHEKVSQCLGAFAHPVPSSAHIVSHSTFRHPPFHTSTRHA